MVVGGLARQAVRIGLGDCVVVVVMLVVMLGVVVAGGVVVAFGVVCGGGAGDSVSSC